MNFSKGLSSVEGVFKSLIKINSDKSITPKNPSLFSRAFSVLSKPKHTIKSPIFELVSVTDDKNQTKISNIKIGDNLFSLQEAKLQLQSGKYQNTNLETIIKSLDFGTNLKSKSSSGDKIGSKLYRDEAGNVFLDKKRTQQVATVKPDSDYVRA
ncbi:MAG: hypothetical protein ISQ32_02460, partial [Rickettsiales bacterium]|nr:hypothetical protein [Rickettsiales bacterium]